MVLIKIKEVTIDYTDCTNDANLTCSEVLTTSNGTDNCTCSVDFELLTAIPVIMIQLIQIS